jgi:Ribose/xylose/arabinose/galactoside ABC-type transport systems, permease components
MNRLRARLFADRPWLPVFGSIVVLTILSYWLVGPRFTTLTNLWSVAKLASFVAVVGAGQGLVILAGGIDLSVPAIITLGGVLLTDLTGGADRDLWWIFPALLALGALVGLINGAGIVFLGLSPVVVTIAIGSIVGSCVLLITGGTPHGATPPAMKFLMQGDVGPIPALALAFLAFAIVVSLLMWRTTFGQRVYAVGNSELAARFSGIRTSLVIIGAYMFSGVCAALTGMLITGFTTQSYLAMGDEYLLPSIAAVVIGGTSIVGGRGHYLGTLGGAIFLSLLGAILLAFSFTDGARQILFGVVVLVAVVASANRRAILEG